MCPQHLLRTLGKELTGLTPKFWLLQKSAWPSLSAAAALKAAQERRPRLFSIANSRTPGSTHIPFQPRHFSRSRELLRTYEVITLDAAQSSLTPRNSNSRFASPAHSTFVGADVDEHAVALVVEMLRNPQVLTRLAAPALPVVSCANRFTLAMIPNGNELGERPSTLPL